MTSRTPDFGWQTRSIGSLTLAASIVMLLTCLIPGRVALLPSLAVGVYGTLLSLWLCRARLRIGEWPVVVLMGTGIACVLGPIAAAGTGGAADVLFTLWVAPMSFVLTGRRFVVLIIWLVLVELAVLLVVPVDTLAIQTVGMTVGTTLVFALWVAVLRSQLERTVAVSADAARTDGLTGLANRTALLEASDRAAGGASLLLIDLDGFKAVNDTHGHAAGDAVLRAVSQRLHDLVRGDDTVARLGGDEFAVLVRDGDPEQLRHRILERLRLPVRHGDLSLRVDASIGVARADAGTPLHELVRQADEAMYAVKRDRASSVGAGGDGGAVAVHAC